MDTVISWKPSSSLDDFVVVWNVVVISVLGNHGCYLPVQLILLDVWCYYTSNAKVRLVFEAHGQASK